MELLIEYLKCDDSGGEWRETKFIIRTNYDYSFFFFLIKNEQANDKTDNDGELIYK